MDQSKENSGAEFFGQRRITAISQNTGPTTVKYTESSLTNREFNDDFEMQNTRKRELSDLDVEKPWRPGTLLATDMIILIAQLSIVLVAFFYFIFDSESSNLELWAINVPSMTLTFLCFTKFLLGVFIFKILARGDSKKITIQLYTARVVYDVVIFGGVMTLLLLYSSLYLPQTLQFALPIVVSEVILFFTTVRTAHKRISDKRRATIDARQQARMLSGSINAPLLVADP